MAVIGTLAQLLTILCSMIMTHRRNEELDDKVVIKKLKQRVAELEAEIQSLKDHSYLSSPLRPSSPSAGLSGTQFSRPLTDTDRQRCHQILYGFFHGKIDNPVSAGKCDYHTEHTSVSFGCNNTANISTCLDIK